MVRARRACTFAPHSTILRGALLGLLLAEVHQVVLRPDLQHLAIHLCQDDEIARLVVSNVADGDDAGDIGLGDELFVVDANDAHEASSLDCLVLRLLVSVGDSDETPRDDQDQAHDVHNKAKVEPGDELGPFRDSHFRLHSILLGRRIVRYYIYYNKKTTICQYWRIIIYTK